MSMSKINEGNLCPINSFECQLEGLSQVGIDFDSASDIALTLTSGTITSTCMLPAAAFAILRAWLEIGTSLAVPARRLPWRVSGCFLKHLKALRPVGSSLAALGEQCLK